LKILFLSDNFPPETNAGALRVSERAEYWSQWGHQVTILTSCPNKPWGKPYPGFKNSFWKRSEENGIQILRVWTFIAPNEGVVLRIIDFLSYMVTSFFASMFVSRSDVIMASSPQFFTAVAGWAAAKLKGIPFVMEVADLWPASVTAVGAMKRGLLTQLAEKLELFLYHQATAIVVLTESFKTNLISRGVPAYKVHTVQNGVKLELFQTSNKSLRNGKGPFVVGYIGTLGLAHGLHNVVLAGELLKDETIEFLIVGDGAERKLLQTSIKERKLSNISLKDAVPRSEVFNLWRNCDAALIHLKNDTVFCEVIPSKIFEAMAMALPIILVAPKGEASALLDGLGCGEWVPAGQPELLAEVVLRWSKRTDLKELGDRAKLEVQKFTRERQARAVIKVLEAVI
jgi:colanic acid biosynthesis glycosyl transferase WcaI